MSELLKLHIGGKIQKPGWKILDYQAGLGVDFVGDISNLTQFADASCESIYAVHVLQHVKQNALPQTLQDIKRLLIPGGQFMLSVPDLETLCKLFISPQLDKAARAHVSRMMFGGQVNAYDFNRIGLNVETLLDYLAAAGFGFVQRVDNFGLFDDISVYAPYGAPISINLLATNLGLATPNAVPTVVKAAVPTSTRKVANTGRTLSQAESILVQEKTNQALSLQEQRKNAEAEALFKEILSYQSDNFAALYSMAVICSQEERLAESLDWIQQAISTVIGQSYSQAYFVEGVVLQALGRFDESLASYEQAIAIDPKFEGAMNNRSNLYYEMKQHIKALESFSDALTVNPDCDKALAGYGIILTEMNHYNESIAYFQRLLTANPEFEYAEGLLLHAEQHCCDWKRYQDSKAVIEAGIRNNKRVCKTLPFMSISNSPEDLYQCVQIFAEHLFPPKQKQLWQGKVYQHDKIRLAYISPDFREHPVGHLMAGIIEHHDKSKFETIGFSLGINDNSSLRNRFTNAFSQFIDVRGRKSWDIAELIYSLEVDILVDLAGYTADSRTDVLAYRPAPIQVNYLGYPGSLGVNYVDYILADHIIIPEGHQQFYTEKVAYLPDAYLPTDANLQVAERTPTRAEMGLPETGIVFCSFNHDYKINPDMFEVWMRILKQVPDSVLWLMKLNESAQTNLREEAVNRGVDPERLLFATRIPLVQDHLARYRLADMFLDTMPYNAHTTASDALFVGLPVVTLQGNTFSGRVASSLLTAIGLTEMITHSFAEYEALAVKLAQDSDYLASIKAKLVANKEHYPLFNTELFSRNMEQVYSNMLTEFQLKQQSEIN